MPPGMMLREELAERGITQTAFAKAIRRPVRAVNEILAGNKSITAETAIAFETAPGARPEFWVKLEPSFQIAKAPVAIRKDRDPRAQI